MAQVESAASEETLRDTLKRAASVLKDAGVEFALAGGFAAYARGAAISTHDVDFVLPERDVEAAVAALTAAGMRHVTAPEDWLAKVYDGDRLIDLIFRPTGRPVDAGLLARAEELPVAAVTMPVLAPNDLVVMRLLAFTETECDFTDYLHVCRSLREQVDWAQVAKETEHNPYAYAFLTLLHRLDVIEGGFL